MHSKGRSAAAKRAQNGRNAQQYLQKHATHSEITAKPDNARDGSRHTGMQSASPVLGCVKLSDFFKWQGISVSSPTVQKVLLRNDMASVYDRWFKVEERHVETGIELTIGHHRTKVRSPQTNGFMERFDKTALNELFRIAFRENFYESVEAPLQAGLDQWLVHYSTERPHRGYRNRGRRPLDTILEFASSARQDS